MNEEIQALCKREPWGNTIELMLFHQDKAGREFVGNLVLESVKEGEVWGDPTARLTQKAAQTLMDELWQCGLRPSEGSGSAGSLAATERHLKDMQRIVFKGFEK